MSGYRCESVVAVYVLTGWKCEILNVMIRAIGGCLRHRARPFGVAHEAMMMGMIGMWLVTATVNVLAALMSIQPFGTPLMASQVVRCVVRLEVVGVESL